MPSKGLKNMVLFVVLAAGIAVGGLALRNHRHAAPATVLAAPGQDSTDRPAPAKPRLPAPRLSTRPLQPEPEPEVRFTNLVVRALKGEEKPKLSPEQAESYLVANRRSAGSLLGAFQATGDKRWLQEAKEKHPNDPAVAFTALFKADSPEERRQWLDALKRAAPDNALADYLSALDCFKAGRTDDAVKELEAAYAKPKIQDYLADRAQDAEEAYRSAGYSEAEAKLTGMMWVELPHLSQLKQLTQQVVDLAASYRQAGDEASAQAALQIGSSLGQRLATGQSTLIQDLVGIAVEKMALSSMDPASPYGSGGQTVKDRLDQLQQQRQAIKALAGPSEGLLQSIPEQDVASYFERLKVFGEYSTMQWLVAKYGKQ
jgi:hypothetical protein